jgi:Xaa-Pro dipeptidase
VYQKPAAAAGDLRRFGIAEGGATVAHTSEVAFPVEEFRARLTGVRAGLARSGLDALIACAPENLYYLSGYESTGHFAVQALVVPAQGEPVLVTRDLETPNVSASYVWERHAAYKDHHEPLAALARQLDALGLGGRRLGLETTGRFVTIADLERLRALLPRATFLSSAGLVEGLRLRKSPRELALIREAGRILDQTFRACFEAIRSGRGEHEVTAEVYRALLLAGSEYIGTPPYVVSGPRSARAHTAWSQRRLQPGDPLFLELGACVRRYHAALMRPAVVAPVSDKLRAMAAASRAGLEAAIAALKPGATSGDVDRACRETIRRAGWGDCFHHRTGYSIGMGFARWSEGHILSIREGDPTVIEAGMVLHIVPFLMVEGEAGVSISETLIVTDSGAEAVCSVPREIALR